MGSWEAHKENPSCHRIDVVVDPFNHHAHRHAIPIRHWYLYHLFHFIIVETPLLPDTHTHTRTQYIYIYIYHDICKRMNEWLNCMHTVSWCLGPTKCKCWRGLCVLVSSGVHASLSTHFGLLYPPLYACRDHLRSIPLEMASNNTLLWHCNPAH